jgi:hypothetical protein
MKEKQIYKTDFTKDYWYAVPPYKKNDGWRVLNECGELIAVFETKEECIEAVNAVNAVNQIKNL